MRIGGRVPDEQHPGITEAELKALVRRYERSIIKLEAAERLKRVWSFLPPPPLPAGESVEESPPRDAFVIIMLFNKRAYISPGVLKTVPGNRVRFFLRDRLHTEPLCELLATIVRQLLACEQLGPIPLWRNSLYWDILRQPLVLNEDDDKLDVKPAPPVQRKAPAGAGQNDGVEAAEAEPAEGAEFGIGGDSDVPSDEEEHRENNPDPGVGGLPADAEDPVVEYEGSAGPAGAEEYQDKTSARNNSLRGNTEAVGGGEERAGRVFYLPPTYSTSSVQFGPLSCMRSLKLSTAVSGPGPG